jgi:hypothetical protein
LGIMTCVIITGGCSARALRKGRAAMAARRTRRIWIGAAVAILAVGIGEAPASAKKKVNTFEGSCSLEGTATFSPPATNSQQSLDVGYESTGTCSGAVNGTPVLNAPVTLQHAVKDVDGSCRRADTTRPGRGQITFGDGTTIAYSFEFHFPGPVGTFDFRGRRSGHAHGVGNFVTPRTPPDILERCAGEGLSEAPLDVSLATDTPLVSGRGGHR